MSTEPQRIPADDLERQVIHNINEYGWHATGLDHDRRLDLTTTAFTLLPGTPCCLLEVAERYYSDYVGFARWYYRRRQFPLYQIVWPNHDGLYPWSPGATKAFREWQPVLGERPGN